jgi:hypothetical protein
MPFISETQSFNIAAPDQLPEGEIADSARRQAPQGPESGIIETIDANLRQYNPVTAAYRKITEESLSNEHDEGFTFQDWQEGIKGYEDDIDLFVGIRNSEDMRIMKSKITERNRHRDILKNANPYANAVSMVGSVLADPLIFVPVVGTIKSATKAGTVGKAAIQGAAIETGAQALRETAFQATQIDRTAKQSIENTLVGGILGATLGGVIGAVTPTTRAAARGAMAEALKSSDDLTVIHTEEGIPQVDLSVGAAKTRSDSELEDLRDLNKSMVKAFSGLGTEALLPAAIRGNLSRFGVVKKWTNKLFPPSAKQNKHSLGIASEDTIQESIRRTQSQMGIVHNSVDKLHKDYLTEAGATIFGKPQNTLTRTQFEEEVWPLMIGKADNHPIPQVEKAAEIYRKVLDNTAKELQQVGLLPENLATATARKYLMRVYNTEKMIEPGVRARTTKKIAEWVATHNKDGSVRKSVLDPVDADDAAIKIYDNILKEGEDAFQANSFARDVTSGGKFNKQRSLLMPDEDLEEILNKDIGGMISSYVLKARGAIDLKKALEAEGFESLADLKTALKLEKDEALRLAKSQEERSKIQEEFNVLVGSGGAKGILDEMTQASMGTLKKKGDSRFLALLKQYQFMRLLGNVVFSSLGEIAMTPFRFGLKNTLNDGYGSLIRDFKGTSLAMDQYADLDVGTELLTNDLLRAITLGDTNIARRRSEFEVMTDKFSDVFGKASGISYYTRFGRRLAAHVGASHIQRTLLNFKASGKLAAHEIEELAELGIGEANYQGIIKHIDRYGEKTKGSFISNIHMWPEDEATAAFKLAVQRAADSTILKPGAGDLPLFAQRTNLGQVLFQFKSFSSAATHKIFYSALQRRDKNVAAGLLMLVALGSTSKIIKDKLAGREPTEDFTELLVEGAQQSGFMGLIGSTALDLTTSLTDNKERRYFGSRLMGTFGGPSASWVKEVGDVMARMADGKVTDKDKQAAIRLLPFNNIFYINALLKQVFEEEK